MTISLPSSIKQGATLNYVAGGPAVAEFPAGAGWVLTLYLNPRAGGVVQTVTSTASGDQHLLQAAATTTATWAPGAYGWEIWATLGAERHPIEEGQLQVLPSLIGAAAGTDTRTPAEIALDAAKAALAAWTPTTRRYKINGREMEFNAPADIIRVIQHWEGEVRRERDAARLAAGLKTGRKVYVRMGRA